MNKDNLSLEHLSKQSTLESFDQCVDEHCLTKPLLSLFQVYFSESLSSLKLDDNDKGDSRPKGARKPLTTFKAPLLHIRYSSQPSQNSLS